MAFDFPVMPRIFYSLRSQNASELVRACCRRPPPSPRGARSGRVPAQPRRAHARDGERGVPAGDVRLVRLRPADARPTSASGAASRPCCDNSARRTRTGARAPLRPAGRPVPLLRGDEIGIGRQHLAPAGSLSAAPASGGRPGSAMPASDHGRDAALFTCRWCGRWSTTTTLVSVGRSSSPVHSLLLDPQCDPCGAGSASDLRRQRSARGAQRPGRWSAVRARCEGQARRSATRRSRSCASSASPNPVSVDIQPRVTKARAPGLPLAGGGFPQVWDNSALHPPRSR